MPGKKPIPIKTETLIELYRGKVAPFKSDNEINQLGAQITQIKNFSHTNTAHQLALQAILGKQCEWLICLGFNRKDYDAWMDNLKENHGETQLITPADPQPEEETSEVLA